jgi:hypothetical protein
VPRQRPRWAEPALPPAPVPEVGVAAESAPTEVGPGVRLGFADGSEVALVDGDPRAVALRAVADLLVRGD